MALSAVPIERLDAQGGSDWETAPLHELIVYIVSRHHTFVRSQLPRIEAVFDRILERKGAEIRNFVLPLGKAFLDLRLDLEAHLAKEENILFPHIVRLAVARKHGAPPPHSTFGSVEGLVRAMENEHDSAKRTLQEMRRLTNGYSLEGNPCRERFDLFEALKELEADVELHLGLENDILHPRALRLESECAAF